MARLRPGSGKGEKVRVFVDSAALCEDGLREEAKGYWEAVLGMSLPCLFRFKRKGNGVAKRPMGTVRLYFNSTYLHRYIQQRAAELAETLSKSAPAAW